MNDLVAEAKYDIALSDLHNAFANIHSSMGLDPFGFDVDGSETVSQLSEKLRQHWEARGDWTAGKSSNENVIAFVDLEEK